MLSTSMGVPVTVNIAQTYIYQSRNKKPMKDYYTPDYLTYRQLFTFYDILSLDYYYSSSKKHLVSLQNKLKKLSIQQPKINQKTYRKCDRGYIELPPIR